MNTTNEIIDYRDPVMVDKVFEAVRQKREAKRIEESLNMSTHEEMIKEDEDVEHESKKTDKYFFKNILFFTNDRDSETNKTLKNLEKAVHGKDVEIFPFVAEEVDYKATDNKIEWHDNKNKYKVDEQSNVDTIVITRLGVQDSEECMELIKELQEWGFFVINPIQSAKKASNKYSSSVLLERYEIPQPRFTLISKNDIAKGEESLNKKLKDIYPDIGKDPDKDKEKEYVIKILDGHGGTGVTMQTGKTILSMLQMVFAVDEERELLVQKKEEADGGDIRVHVLTMRTHQKILAQMKRKKIGGDFRSNVSLGATAEPVKLTPEQEEIALKVAKISGMPWCAVDIMPLVKGSNPEVGDNVVLEYNASPGTDGISEVINDNFMKILLDEINDVNELVLAPKAIGYLENVKFTMDNDDEFEFEAKFDTGNGAKASTIGCESVEYKGNLVTATINGKKYQFKKAGESKAIVGQITEPRTTVIIPCIQVGSRKLLDVEFALVDNRNKKQKVLINRDIMARLAYQINPGKKHILEDDLAYSFKEEADKKAKEAEERKKQEKTKE
jgi:ribosomal protein S6--L-glutamate ligase